MKKSNRMGLMVIGIAIALVAGYVYFVFAGGAVDCQPGVVVAGSGQSAPNCTGTNLAPVVKPSDAPSADEEGNTVDFDAGPQY